MLETMSQNTTSFGFFVFVMVLELNPINPTHTHYIYIFTLVRWTTLHIIVKKEKNPLIGNFYN